MVDTLIPDRIQATGASTNIRRTITPWKTTTVMTGHVRLYTSCKLSWSVFTYSKIDACDTIHDDEDVCICELKKAVIQANREHEHHQLQVKVEWRPCCRLMFRNWCNNGNVVFGIRRVQQRVEAAGPGRDFASEGENTTNSCDANCCNQHNTLEQQLEVIFGHACSHVVHKGMDLAQTKHTECLQWRM